MRLSTAKIPYKDEEICGFVVVGESETDAISVAEIALTHYETPGPKSAVSVILEKNQIDDGFLFQLQFGSAGSVRIDNVNKIDIVNLLEILPSSPGYFVCLGRLQGNEVILLPTSTFFLVKHDIIAEGRLIKLPFRTFDWETLKFEMDQTISKSGSGSL